jgi:hypothetical protein
MFLIGFTLSSCSNQKDSSDTSGLTSLAFTSTARFSNDNINYFDDISSLNLEEVIYIDLEVGVSRLLPSQIDTSFVVGSVLSLLLIPIAGLVAGRLIFDKPINKILGNDFDLYLEVNNPDYHSNVYITKGTLRKDTILETENRFGFFDEIVVNRNKNYIIMVNYPYLKSLNLDKVLDFDLDLFQDGIKLAEFNYKIDFE